MSKSDTVDNNSSAVLVELISAKVGSIGVVTLNSEKTLNALSLEMVRIIADTLKQWQENDDLKAVILRGAGNKAFCAGGDVQALYASAINQVDGACVEAEQFFYEEYQLNYLMHTYEKPIVCIGHGIVMGGGLGLLASASHRVVTNTTKLAMPEITIGLFPDVGGTYFLNQVPYNLGYFLALTGAMINAADTLFCRLAEFAINQENIDLLINDIVDISFQEDIEVNHRLITEVIDAKSLNEKELDASAIRRQLPLLERIFQNNSLCQIVAEIEKFDESNEFLRRAKSTMLAGSPLSLIAIYEQLKRYRFSDLQTIFEGELILATNLVRHPDFAEGVRALLIDKDKSPKWAYPHYTSIPSSVIDSLFAAPWSENPLSKALN